MTPHLAAIRGAQRDRIDAAAVRADNGSGPCGMPYTLQSVSCWLIANGVPDDLPCAGEIYFNMPLSYFRAYFEALTPAQRIDEIEGVERIVFHGRRPLWQPEMYLEAAE